MHLALSSVRTHIHTWSSCFYLCAAVGMQVEVPVDSLDEVLAGQHVDLLKVVSATHPPALLHAAGHHKQQEATFYKAGILPTARHGTALLFNC